MLDAEGNVEALCKPRSYRRGCRVLPTHVEALSLSELVSSLRGSAAARSGLCPQIISEAAIAYKIGIHNSPAMKIAAQLGRKEWGH
jgi:hypothetical protein